MAGLEIRRPEWTRSGVYIDAEGSVWLDLPGILLAVHRHGDRVAGMELVESLSGVGGWPEACRTLLRGTGDRRADSA